jgi:hypothetical protein
MDQKQNEGSGIVPGDNAGEGNACKDNRSADRGYRKSYMVCCGKVPGQDIGTAACNIAA